MYGEGDGQGGWGLCEMQFKLNVMQDMVLLIYSLLGNICFIFFIDSLFSAIKWAQIVSWEKSTIFTQTVYFLCINIIFP